MNEKGIPNATQSDNRKLKNSPNTRQTKNNPITKLLERVSIRFGPKDQQIEKENAF